jgi:hypothetical protein
MINQCRIYLQVITLSVIISANGRQITLSIFFDFQTDRESKLDWPFQPKPSKSAMRVWENFLSHIHRFGKLNNPLGPWLCESHQKWCWFSDPVTKAAYHLINKQWHCHPPITSPIQSQRLRSSKTWYSLLSFTVSHDIPRVLLPTTIEFSPGPHPIHFSHSPSQVPFPPIHKEYLSI